MKNNRRCLSLLSAMLALLILFFGSVSAQSVDVDEMNNEQLQQQIMDRLASEESGEEKNRVRRAIR